MKKFYLIASYALILGSLAACNAFSTPIASPQTPTIVSETVVATATQESTLPENTEPQILRIWLPPEFDPAAETDAGALLRTRLETFQKRRPDLILDVRIKAVTGQASLLNALLTTQNAAPSAMPDLIALKRADLEIAAQQGSLHPIDGLTNILDDPDWYPYVRPLAHIQNSAYGLPFAANLLGLAYRPAEDAPRLPNVASLQEQKTQIIFPADSAQARLSFCLYAASGAPLRNEQGLPALEINELTNILEFYQSELFSPKSAELQDTSALWDAFLAQPEIAAAVWTNDYLVRMPADTALAPLPTPDGTSCSLATAWIWALAGSSPDLQPAAVELAEYLVESNFLTEWTAASGTLSPRPTSFAESQNALHELSLIAQPIPANEVGQSLGEIFQKATMSVLRDQVSPSAAAQEALENIQ